MTVKRMPRLRPIAHHLTTNEEIDPSNRKPFQPFLRQQIQDQFEVIHALFAFSPAHPSANPSAFRLLHGAFFGQLEHPLASSVSAPVRSGNRISFR